jgi:AmmeMemoRadiSam system protein B/AmmeMemoRadiSam system protein A
MNGGGNRRGRGLRALILLAGMALALAATRSGGESRAAWAASRPAAVAGQFYPGDHASLATNIQSCLSLAKPPQGPRPIGLVVPHAGYVYCGQIMADAWRQAEGGKYDLIVILGANHTTPGFDKIAVWRGGPWLTPLGAAPVDGPVAAALLAADPLDCDDSPLPHEREHSVEVEVPWAQTLFPSVPILPVVVGTEDLGSCQRFGEALARVIAGRRVLIVASSDLSHYPSRTVASRVDRATLAAIASLDGTVLKETIRAQMGKHLPGLVTCACGEAPILAMISAVKTLGATTATVIAYANSGDVPAGEPTRVVGYGAVAVTGPTGRPAPNVSLPASFAPQALAPVDAPPPAPARPRTSAQADVPVRVPVVKARPGGATGADAGANPGASSGAGAISPADRATLLALARSSIAGVFARSTPDSHECGPTLRVRRGAFVTLQLNGQLRGCIGHMAEDMPLCDVVREMAQAAAFHDYRFSPLRVNELGHCRIEISVLTPAAPIAGPDQIVLGRDGVILDMDGRSAVFLPQVAPEQGWDVPTLLAELSRKAGLPPDAWRSGAAFRTFQAEVFGEARDR